MSPCGRRWSHSLKGKDRSQAERLAMKWFFRVRMAPPAALRRWLLGVTHWKFTACLVNFDFIYSEQLLLSIWSFNAYPLTWSLA